VVAAEAGHVFHNRLTHSLQVAQVGRRIAERLHTSYLRSGGSSDGFNPDVVEAACLAHDLGHPPFGHVAETKLNELAGETVGGFEGNAQSFRIVTRLSQHSPNHRGLDLTRATLAAILKYPWMKGANPKKLGKWGAYTSEMKDFQFATALLPAQNVPTLEAKLMDWADDITYSVHDLEDFYRAGRIPLHLLGDSKYEKERQKFFTAVYNRHPEREGIWKDRSALEEAFNQLIIGLFPLDQEYTGEWKQRARLRDFTSQLIGRFVGGTSISAKLALEIDPDRELEVAMLKELTWVYVIENPGLATEQEAQRRIIESLFSLYWAAAQDKNRRQMFSAFYRSGIDEASTDDERKRVVVDFIAGMTEMQAVLLHNRLLGTNPGSGLDQVVF